MTECPALACICIPIVLSCVAARVPWVLQRPSPHHKQDMLLMSCIEFDVAQYHSLRCLAGFSACGSLLIPVVSTLGWCCIWAGGQGARLRIHRPIKDPLFSAYSCKCLL